MLPRPLHRLIRLLARFPGVGEKTAQRYVLHLISQDTALAEDLAHELASLARTVRPCQQCGNLAEVAEDEPTADGELAPVLCQVCLDESRDDTLLCIVGKLQDLFAIERSGAMRGRYFVLGRLLSPLDGIGPDELPLGRLFERVERLGVKEVIVATPPSVDGEATALFLGRELSSRGLSVTRIASGVPHGGDLEFADQVTLGRAIDGRRKLDV